ncbi:hypothetical protein AWC31_13965 [Mycolicibacterium wolinskyi]|uniref:Uncharacterized protein n=1 Tax=Mycolicibacterium wolinskyi TaxID=59750 RepID=A0A1X2FJE2_9MYCO|nr:hypothetical protein AWC31_13965 [Mycolicibacterium wolinskyi]
MGSVPTQSGGRLRGAFAKAIGWLRTGYAEQAPTGHSPLIALCGPVTLSEGEIGRAVTMVGDGPASGADIDVAIAKVTNRLPTPHQRDAVNRALHRGRYRHS